MSRPNFARGPETLYSGADDMLAGELPKALRNVAHGKQALSESHRIHSAKTTVDTRTKAEQLAQAEAFYADRSSKWARIVRMSERGRR